MDLERAHRAELVVAISPVERPSKTKSELNGKQKCKLDNIKGSSDSSYLRSPFTRKGLKWQNARKLQKASEFEDVAKRSEESKLVAHQAECFLEM